MILGNPGGDFTEGSPIHQTEGCGVGSAEAVREGFLFVRFGVPGHTKDKSFERVQESSDTERFTEGPCQGNTPVVPNRLQIVSGFSPGALPRRPAGAPYTLHAASYRRIGNGPDEFPQEFVLP
jgi:hypothetical protein